MEFKPIIYNLEDVDKIDSEAWEYIKNEHYKENIEWYKSKFEEHDDAIWLLSGGISGRVYDFGYDKDYAPTNNDLEVINEITGEIPVFLKRVRFKLNMPYISQN